MLIIEADNIREARTKLKEISKRSGCEMYVKEDETLFEGEDVKTNKPN